MEVSAEFIGLAVAGSTALFGWVVSVERRLASQAAAQADVRKTVRRVDRRVEFLIGTLAGRKMLEDMLSSERDDEEEV